jgi:hypothetical protein
MKQRKKYGLNTVLMNVRYLLLKENSFDQKINKKYITETLLSYKFETFFSYLFIDSYRNESCNLSFLYTLNYLYYLDQININTCIYSY